MAVFTGYIIRFNCFHKLKDRSKIESKLNKHHLMTFSRKITLDKTDYFGDRNSHPDSWRILMQSSFLTQKVIRKYVLCRCYFLTFPQKGDGGAAHKGLNSPERSTNLPLGLMSSILN